jgi:hypothetical protein
MIFSEKQEEKKEAQSGSYTLLSYTYFLSL